MLLVIQCQIQLEDGMIFNLNKKTKKQEAINFLCGAVALKVSSLNQLKDDMNNCYIHEILNDHHIIDSMIVRQIYYVCEYIRHSNNTREALEDKITDIKALCEDEGIILSGNVFNSAVHILKRKASLQVLSILLECLHRIN